ncbi:unnamed protein product [Calypogeia fissa]
MSYYGDGKPPVGVPPPQGYGGDHPHSDSELLQLFISTRSAMEYCGGYPPQGYPPQGYPPQDYPPQGYPPQGYPQQGYPPQQGMYAPQPQYQQQQQRAGPTFAEGCLAALCCCCLCDLLF